MNLILHDFLKVHNQLVIARLIWASQKKLFILLTPTTFLKNVVYDKILIQARFKQRTLKRRYLFTGLHDITSKKIAIIVTAILNSKSQIFNLFEWNKTEFLSTQSSLNWVYYMSLWWQL